MYIGDYMARRALYSPDATAVIDAGKTAHLRLTYAQMNTRANRLAHILQGMGVKAGDRVGILAHNGVEFLDAFFACGKLGAILACYNWRLHWRETLALFEATQPVVTLFSGDFAEIVGNISAHTDVCRHYIYLDDPFDWDDIAHSYDYEVLMENASDAPMSAEHLTEEDTACLIFTGGTTGLPKGARISHRMIVWNTLNTVIHDIQHGDVTVNTFPMFHTGGLLVYTLPLLILGGTVVLTRRFDPEQTLDLVQSYGATFFAGVPTMYQMLTTAPNWPEADLSRLRFCTSGGAPLPVALVEKFQAEKGVRFKQGFGMSEFGPGVFALAPEDAIRKAGSIGRPTFFTDARIVDDDNQPVPPDTVGELVLKGRAMTSGYFGLEDAPITDADGWFHTGDLARMDSEGYFFIVDRKKDMFISGGENVYPAEIEQVLHQHPAVQMCAVVGVPDDKWGEVGKAFVVLKSAYIDAPEATPEALITFMTTRLARYKVPRYAEIVSALPISGAGKILKRELRERGTPHPPHP